MSHRAGNAIHIKIKHTRGADNRRGPAKEHIKIKTDRNFTAPPRQQPPALPTYTVRMDANARWEYALQLHADAPKRSKKCVTLRSGGNEWRAGPRPKPPSAGDKYEEDGVVSRSFLRASRVEQQGHAERRQAARAFDGLSHRQVVQVAQSVDVASLVVRWRYTCALDGVSHTVVEADGWLKPALAAALQAEVDAELKAVSDRANAEAARQCREIERMAQDARAKEQYAKVEVRMTRSPRRACPLTPHHSSPSPSPSPSPPCGSVRLR